MNELEEYFYGSYTNIYMYCYIITINTTGKDFFFFKYNKSVHQLALEESLWIKIVLVPTGPY